MKTGLLLLTINIAAYAQANQYNPIYRGEAGQVFSREPNQLLVEAVRQRKPGTALDLGMGQGRNAIYLAQLGWDVTGIDSSDAGIEEATTEAARQGVKLRALVSTFEEFDFGVDRWDLIVMTYEPTKMLAPRVVRALKLGGLVVVEDRHVDTLRVWPAGTFADNELLTLFPDLRTLKYEDTWARPDWSARKIDERLVRLVAEKPMPRLPGCVWDGKQIDEGGTVCWGVLKLYCSEKGWHFERGKCIE